MASQSNQPQPQSTNAHHDTEDIILTLPNNITVRRYRLTDIVNLSHHGNNKRIWDNLRNRMPHPYTEADSEFWVSQARYPGNWIKSGPWTPETGSTGPAIPTQYAICISGEAVGSIGLEIGDGKDIYARNAKIGYWLGETHWGKGIMGVVVPAFVEWTWETFGRLVRLNSEVWEKNVGSRRCLEKAGFVVEGRRNCGFWKHGRLQDAVLLGMLRPGMDAEERSSG